MKLKTWKSGKVFVYFNFWRNSKSKNQKNGFKQEKRNFKMKFFLKKKNSEVSKFSIWPYKQNQKLRNLRKFSFALNFNCFDCIKCREAENVH